MERIRRYLRLKEREMRAIVVGCGECGEAGVDGGYEAMSHEAA